MRNICWLLVLLSACNAGFDSGEKGPDKKMTVVDSAQIWKSSVLEYGDSIAYGKLALELSFNQMDHWALLYYSQVMCNKYNNAGACLDCYKINCEVLSPDNLKTYDSATYIMGEYYLLRAHELGNSSAKYYVKKHFGSNIPHAKDLRDSILWKFK